MNNIHRGYYPPIPNMGLIKDLKRSISFEPKQEEKFFKFLLLAGFRRTADKKEAMSSCDFFL